MTTAATLRRLRTGLLASALILLVAVSFAAVKTRTSTDAVANGTAPSIVELLAAREALAAADAAVVGGFRSGEVRLAGTGSEYQSQVAVASQSLARAAENNLAGEAASRTIQRLQSLLVEYLGLVGEAESRYRLADGDLLWRTYLWNASRLMETESTGILAELDELVSENERLLADQIGPGWLTVATAASWLLPLVILFLLLLITLTFLSVRFRRSLNMLLIAAVAVVLASGVAAASSLVADQELRAVSGDLAQVAAGSQARVASLRAQRDENLAVVMRAGCEADGQSDAECRHAIDVLLARQDQPEGSTVQSYEAEMTAGPAERTAAAREAAAAVLLAPLAVLVIPLLVVFGLQPRFDEYRYRVR